MVKGVNVDAAPGFNIQSLWVSFKVSKFIFVLLAES